MFNLNIPPTSLLGIEGSGLCTTPKTPEIVNSLIAMTTNPLDNYNFNNMTSNGVASTTAGLVTNLQLLSQDSNHSSSSATPLDSPAGSTTTPSVQQKLGQVTTIKNKKK